MTPVQRALLIDRARAARLVARYENDEMIFTPENPVDPDAPPYFTCDAVTECLAFLTGWHMRGYDVDLRNLARIQSEKQEQ